MQDIERYAQLSQRKAELKRDLESVQKEMVELEQRLLDDFAEQGVQSIKTSSGYTVYLRGQWWARPADGDYDRAIDALRRAGLEDMVKETVNVQSLSAWLREFKRDDPDAPLPASFDGSITATQQFNVLVRKS